MDTWLTVVKKFIVVDKVNTVKVGLCQEEAVI